MEQPSDANAVYLSENQQISPQLAEAIQVELDRILTSRTFHAAQGQRAFLRFAVSQALSGRGHLLKEYVIGVEALGRSAGFDPRLDPIVRTQARKLRVRLDKYYENEGHDSEIRIAFPKGSYSPSFEAIQLNKTVPPSVTRDESLLEDKDLPAAFHPLRQNRRLVTAAALALVAFLGFATVMYEKHHSGVDAKTFATKVESAVAVMPLLVLDAHQASNFLTDGLTNELIGSLRSIPGVRVVAYPSSFSFQASFSFHAGPVDFKELHRKLHVKAVLSGTVRRSGSQLQIILQLNSVPQGFRLWTGSYDRKIDDLPTVKSEITDSVANVLGSTLVHPGEATELLVRSTPNSATPNRAAYESYLKGLHFWRRFNADDLIMATHYFEHAIAQDPGYAKAYAALADCYVMTPQLSPGVPPSAELSEKIGRAATQAIALDSSLGEPHFDLAIAHEYNFNWDAAEAEFKQGLELSPGSAVGHLWYAKYLALVGRKAEVLAQRKAAAQLDPVSAYAAQSVAGCLSVLGHYDSAITQFRSALDLEPNFALAHQGLGFTLLLAGRHSEALNELKIAQHVSGGPYREAILAYAYSINGQTAAAQKMLADFLQRAKRSTFPAAAVAIVYIGLGDKENAFRWLDKAVDQRDLTLDLQWDPLYRPIRPDPRYATLLRRMKLPQAA